MHAATCGRIQTPDHISLEGGVTLSRVNDDNVHFLSREGLDTLVIALAGADRSAAQKLLRCFVHRAVGIVAVLEQICARNEGNQVALRVDDGQLAFLAVLHELVRLRQRAALFRNDEVAGHHLTHRQIIVSDKINISRAHHANKLSTDLPRLCDWDACMRVEFSVFGRWASGFGVGE